MNSFWMSLEFFGLIFAELTVLFLGISTLVGLVLQYVSSDTLRRWLSKKGLLGNFLGVALGAVQLLPLYELVRTSFRQGSASLEQVLGWAYPKRRLLAWQPRQTSPR